MVADVPLGAFLSGGIDSSLIVALMQARSARPVKTFTIGFRETAYDEARHARAVARHLGTDHTEVQLTGRDALNIVPRLPRIYDEPFADASQIPTFLLSQTTRHRVTVSLSGDGGDEVFGGYDRYVFAHRVWPHLARMPQVLRSFLAQGAWLLRTDAWPAVAQPAARLLPAAGGPGFTGERAGKLAHLLSSADADTLCRRMLERGETVESCVLGAREPPTGLLPTRRWPSIPALAERLMALDTGDYLPDDLLVKVDRAAMAVGLETRVPFLDHRVFHFAWRLPFAFKWRNGRTKWILRRLLERHVPRRLIERPKQGFNVPIGDWLRGPLRDWGEDLLDARRMREAGFLNANLIRQKWAEHVSGACDWQSQLWAVLMFQAWRRSN
jgi:asparagine synthase (glutamine-hydrolysing)